MCLQENGEAIQGKEIAQGKLQGEKRSKSVKEILCRKVFKYVKCGKQLEEATDILSNCSA